MTKLSFKSAMMLAIYLTALLFAGCSSEFIEREKFKIKTIDGKILTFACPVINLERSSLSYIYDGDCVIINVDDN